MAAFIPGESPPDVKTPIFFIFPIKPRVFKSGDKGNTFFEPFKQENRQ
jgi:hypothetical protein